MHELDDDDCQMTDFQGNPTQRDLVQFVEFRKHNNNGVELAKEVLEELPRLPLRVWSTLHQHEVGWDWSCDWHWQSPYTGSESHKIYWKLGQGYPLTALCRSPYFNYLIRLSTILGFQQFSLVA